MRDNVKRNRILMIYINIDLRVHGNKNEVSDRCRVRTPKMDHDLRLALLKIRMEGMCEAGPSNYFGDTLNVMDSCIVIEYLVRKGSIVNIREI